MSSVLFGEDPKYNGPHICPKCGNRSHWKATNFDQRMIMVRCETCGEYSEAYSQLSEGQYFKEGQIPVE
jgi:predicted nucleic-acid-binding Zn-ribbon protein